MFARFKKTRADDNRESQQPPPDGKGLDGDKRYKVVFLGDCGVGSKTSFIKRYCNNVFEDITTSTIGVDYHAKKVEISGQTVNLMLWDITGQEMFASIAPVYTRNADALVFGYDITDRGSFESITGRWTELIKLALPDAQLMLIGNKLDLSERREVPFIEGEELATGLGTDLFFEVSAKTGENVFEAMEALAEKLVNKPKH